MFSACISWNPLTNGYTGNTLQVVERNVLVDVFTFRLQPTTAARSGVRVLVGED